MAGKRNTGRFNKLNGHKSTSAFREDWQDADYISPLVDSALPANTVESKALVEPIRDKDEKIIGFRVKDVSVSLVEGQQILTQLKQYF
jgi:hypothetical protein